MEAPTRNCCYLSSHQHHQYPKYPTVSPSFDLLWNHFSTTASLHSIIKSILFSIHNHGIYAPPAHVSPTTSTDIFVQTSIGTGYDLSNSVFSPDGRNFQVRAPLGAFAQPLANTVRSNTQ